MTEQGSKNAAKRQDQRHPHEACIAVVLKASQSLPGDGCQSKVFQHLVQHLRNGRRSRLRIARRALALALALGGLA